MRNQVLADGYPQNPSLIHNNNSQEFQLDRVKSQIENLKDWVKMIRLMKLCLNISLIKL